MTVCVLLSGGMDSVTALYEVCSYHQVVAALSFDYGAKHNANELAFARLHALKAGVPHQVVALDFIDELFDSALLRSGAAIPDGHYAEATMKQTVVPFRNGIMLAIATGYAESIGAQALVIAAHAGDHAIYPDCREPFLQAMAEAMLHGTYANIQLLRPFIASDKADIARRGIAYVPENMGIFSDLTVRENMLLAARGAKREQDIDRDIGAAKSCIGIVPQEINFNQFESVETILVNQAGFYGIPRPVARERTERYLKQLQLWEKRRAIARSLSGGMKRRLMIARALVHEPRLLILDEPTAGVDIEIRRTMWEFLRETNERGVTIILTTHYLEEAETLCRNVAIIDKGRIIETDKMSNVLRTLQTETFVLNLREALPIAPSLPGFGVTLVDPRTLEIEVSNGHNLNDIFVRLAAQGIDVVSMRNKVNRLEEQFMRLVGRSGSPAGASGDQP